MVKVENKTKKPLRVPLPGGKKLHLGPSAAGEINAKAIDHPPLQKLVEAGEIEIIDDGGGRNKSSGGGRSGISGAHGRTSGGGSMRHTGDR